MKKILLLLLTVLTLTSCLNAYRSDDVFVVISKENGENGNTSYKYLYRTKLYMTSVKDGLYYLDDFSFVSNENYELGDTIKFIRYASNEKIRNYGE